MSLKNKKASVLILSVWAVIFLAVLAAQVGLHIRQRASVLSRLETNSQQHYIADAGIKKAISSLRLDLSRNKGLYSSYGKYFRHNNAEHFEAIKVGSVMAEVSYTYFGGGIGLPKKQYGFVDEERKINVNTEERNVLLRLIQHTANLTFDEARDITDAIIDWREMGESQVTGFYSDSYYTNLQYPYEPKNAYFELIDELLLLKGIDESIFEKIRPFLTVYGNGRVNINTASPAVFLAFGLETVLIDKILQVRRGLDNIENTVDDYIFHKTFDVASEMKGFVKLDLAEIKAIDQLNSAGKIKTNSSFYKIQSFGKLTEKDKPLVIESIYNAEGNKIEYWREK